MDVICGRAVVYSLVGNKPGLDLFNHMVDKIHSQAGFRRLLSCFGKGDRRVKRGLMFLGSNATVPKHLAEH